MSGEIVQLVPGLDPDLDEGRIEALIEEHDGDIRKIARKLGVGSRRLRKFVAKSARLTEACEEVWECAVDQSVGVLFEGLRDEGSFQNRFYAAKEFLRTGAARKRGFGHEASGQAMLELKDKGGARTITLRWLEAPEGDRPAGDRSLGSLPPREVLDGPEA